MTGLLYVDPRPKDLRHLNTVEAPLNTLHTPDLCPGPAAFDKITPACARQRSSFLELGCVA